MQEGEIDGYFLAFHLLFLLSPTTPIDIYLVEAFWSWLFFFYYSPAVEKNTKAAIRVGLPPAGGVVFMVRERSELFLPFCWKHTSLHVCKRVQPLTL